MKISPLQLEHSLIEEITIKPARGAKEFCENLDISAAPSYTRSDSEPTRWQVGLDIGFSAKGDKPSPYSGSIRVIGWFRVVAEKLDEERQLQIVSVNAPSILYSTAREVIAGITSRGLNGLFLLPSVSFVDLRITPSQTKTDQPDKKAAAKEEKKATP